MFVVVQSLSCVQLFVTPWPTTCQATLSSTSSWRLLKPMSIESVLLSNCLIDFHPLLLLPSLFPSIRVFSNESALCIRWPQYWSFSFSISPSSEYSGLISFRILWYIVRRVIHCATGPLLISFRIDWFDLLGVQGILRSLLQHHTSKASILQCSAFFLKMTECIPLPIPNYVWSWVGVISICTYICISTSLRGRC